MTSFARLTQAVALLLCAATPPAVAQGAAPTQESSAGRAAKDTHADLVAEADRLAAESQVDSGIFTLSVDNDLFVGKDSNYTAGGSLSWTTPAVRSLREGNFFRGMTNVVSFLPTVGDDAYRKFVSMELGLEIHTPQDLSANPPPPDQWPYSGIWALDTTVYSQSEKSLHGYTLRLGFVGPSTRAAEIQTELHELWGAPIPQGWDHQLHDELLINAGYRYHYRALRLADRNEWGFDVTGHAGADLGTYHTGALAGVGLRAGHNVPRSYSVSPVVAGRHGQVDSEPPPDGAVSFYLAAKLEGVAMARYLPLDGNTFRESASVDRDDFFPSTMLGVFVGYGPATLSFSVFDFGDIFSFERAEGADFGSIQLSVVF